MNNKMETAVTRKLERRARAKSAEKADTARRTAARRAYRAKIESLLDKSDDELLASLWQRVCPLPLGLTCELPDRSGIIRDLADFAEVLRPSLEGLKVHRLCWLVEKYAACRQAQPI